MNFPQLPIDIPYPPHKSEQLKNITRTLPHPITLTITKYTTNLTIHKTKQTIINKNNTKHQPTNKWKPNKIHTNHKKIQLTSVQIRYTKSPTIIQKINKQQAFELHHNLYLNTQAHPHTKYTITPKHKMVSAYRPRHKIHNDYQSTNKTKRTTKDIHKNNTHLLPKQLKKITLILHYNAYLTHKHPQPEPKHTSHPNHRPHPRFNPHPKNVHHPKYETHSQLKIYPKNKVHPQPK